MLFSQLIGAISEIIPLKPLITRDLLDIRDTALLDGVQDCFQNDVLYIGYYTQLINGKLPQHCLLAGCPADLLPPGAEGDLALADEKSLFFLFNLAKTLVDASRRKGLYAELMDCAVQTKSVPSFVNLAASKLGNTVVLLDRGYKVLASSSIYPVEDKIWAQNISQGYCSYEFISAVNALDSIKQAPNTPEPVVVTCYASPMKKLSSKIFCGGRMIGFVVMLEEENPLNAAHFELLPQVGAAAGDYISRYAPYLLPDSTHYQRLLYDLLIGAPPDTLAPSIEKLRFPSSMSALRLVQTRDQGPKLLKEQIAEKLKALMPGTQLTFHENGIAALITPKSPSGLSDEQRALLVDFADAEHLRIGVSNVFTGIENFARHYAQARHALDLSVHLKDGDSVCSYADYAFYDLLDNAKKAGDLGFFCHPALAQLRAYDTQNNTELLRTLDVYLANDCSIKQSSARLFIHRNSLAYRLRRIFDLTRLDLSDSNTRFLLGMSFAIAHFNDI